jgi:hypothetical protein
MMRGNQSRCPTYLFTLLSSQTLLPKIGGRLYSWGKIMPSFLPSCREASSGTIGAANSIRQRFGNTDRAMIHRTSRGLKGIVFVFQAGAALQLFIGVRQVV